ncbi:hypothetical protein CEUSTIGMA_g10315.t1 [Chlamydomonas eustigma]|uniref:Presenilin n=1 Tax=Chlamydomonas eustigma TaxID=1157962 RepID=A0A250XIZ2_9CHLO|nr:hypothetical protein CEUSTIGMA_g10315.t1 [Chlamydomonas eustigma]|eukprot:GAX82889.1 hypothetical protein CEUSTIGMA_g10315.t1 [Chlamydomonas eustigma]
MSSRSLENKPSVLDDLGIGITSIVWPVSICMAVTVFLVRVLNPTGQTSSSTVFIASAAYNENGNADASSAQKLGGALLNAIIFISVIAATTVVLVILFKYQCYRFIFAYMGFSIASLLFVVTGVLLIQLLQVGNVNVDAFSFCYILWNFSVIGTLGSFFMPVPLLLKQCYMVWIGIMTAFIFTWIPDWTSWVLLVAMALYDIAAVLIPGGPLKMLVELAIEREQALPALIYESRPTEGYRGPNVWRRRRPEDDADVRAQVGQDVEDGQASLLVQQQIMTGRESEQHQQTQMQMQVHQSHDQGLGSEDASGAPLESGLVRQGRPLGEGREDGNSRGNYQELASGSPDSRPNEEAIATTEDLVIPVAEGREDSGDGLGRYNLLLGGLNVPLASSSPQAQQRESVIPGGSTSGNRQPFISEEKADGVAEKGDALFGHGIGTVTPSSGSSGGLSVGGDPDNRDRVSTAPLASGETTPGPQLRAAEEWDNVAEDDEEEVLDMGDGMKLGLGDFIFYSMLVGKAAQYDMMTVFASYIGIIAGLGITLLCLNIYRQALPALPFSIALGVLFYFSTVLVTEQYVVPLTSHYTFY